jgi:hypothetical protein
MLGAAILQGAGGRLLPASVPLRFFAAAVAAHVAFWAMLLATSDQLAGFRGGFAPLLAAVHLLTIGVLVMTAIGAAVQILPVVTRRPLAAVWPVKLVFWLLLPGLVVLAVGFYGTNLRVASAGAGIVAAALLLFAAVLADSLRRASGAPIIVAYGWAALACLIATVGLGLKLIADFTRGGSAKHAAYALGHVILGGFGYMGLLAVGFSHVLVPMFTLAQVPDRSRSWTGFATATLAVALGAASAVWPAPDLLPAAAAVGVIGCGLYLWLMRQALRDGMRRRLGLSFVLVRAAWVLQVATLAVGLLAALGRSGRQGSALFGLLLFTGWLLTFLLAILQRILPMLASMHVAPARRVASGAEGEGAPVRWLPLHACCHALALAIIGVGVVADAADLVRLGSAIGLVGAAAYAAFTLRVLTEIRRAATPPAPTGRPAT